MNSNQVRRAGFTLVEIMIVVAIIGLLAGIAIPNYLRSVENTKQTACINNLQQIEGAIVVWAAELKKDTGDAVAYSDISAYLRRQVTCPSGGTSFADSYTITTVDAPPLCQRKAQTHKLPL